MEKRNTRNNLLIIVMLGLILVAGAVLACLLIFADRGPENGVDMIIRDNETVRQEQEAEKNGNGNSSGNSKDQPGGSDRPETVAPDNGEKAVAVVQVTSMVAKDGVFSASGMVNNTTRTDGQCTFGFYAPDGTLTKVDAESLANPTSIACATSSVPLNGKKGIWKVVLWYTSETMEGVSREEPYEVK